MLDSLEYIVHSSHGSEPWLGALTENTSPDENGIPGVLGQGRFVKLVRAADIRLWGIAYEVHSLWR